MKVKNTCYIKDGKGKNMMLCKKITKCKKLKEHRDTQKMAKGMKLKNSRLCKRWPKL
jgi:hypothetical protein